MFIRNKLQCFVQLLKHVAKTFRAQLVAFMRLTDGYEFPLRRVLNADECRG